MKKPSRGVVFFGCLFIGSGLVSITRFSLIVSFVLSGDKIGLLYSIYTIFSFIVFILQIICGVLLFQLKKIAPVLAIILAISGILLAVFFSVNLNYIGSGLRESLMYSELLTEDQHATKAGFEGLVRFLNIYVYGSVVWALIINSIIIYFFRKPEVKQQFEASA